MVSNIKQIEGNVKKGEHCYAIINTAAYNNDGKFSVMVVDIEQLKHLGFDDKEVEDVKNLEMGEQIGFEYGLDAQVVRIA